MSITRGAIILCGGKSSRMGLAKATLPFGPEVLLQRVVRLVRPVVDSIVVVAAPDQELPPLPDEVRLVRDRAEGRGPLEGLAAGFTALRDSVDAAYATGCDVPFMVPALVKRLFELLQDHEIVVPTDGRFHHPLSAVYRTQVLERIESLLAEGRMRPFYLFEQSDTLEVSVDRVRDVDPELATLENLNRPSDYLEALKRAGFQAPPDVLDTFSRNERKEGDTTQ